MKPQGLPCSGSNNYKKFASGSSAQQRKTPDREENDLLLIQIRRSAGHRWWNPKLREKDRLKRVEQEQPNLFLHRC
jgi:hypothetical protein